MRKTSSKDFDRPWYIKYALLLFGGCAFLIIGGTYFYFVVLSSSYGEDFDKMSKSGDSFGGLNVVFSGLAFIGVVFTLFIQRKELELTLHEMVESTVAQKKSSEALDAQLKSIDRNNTINILQNQLSSGRIKTEFERERSNVIIDHLVGEILKDKKYSQVLYPSLESNQDTYLIDPQSDTIHQKIRLKNKSPLILEVDERSLLEGLKYKIHGSSPIYYHNFDSSPSAKSIKMDKEKEVLYIEIVLPMVNSFAFHLILTDLITGERWRQVLAFLVIEDHFTFFTLTPEPYKEH